MFSKKNAVVLTVVPLLVVILIYSSLPEFDVFTKSSVHKGPIFCFLSATTNKVSCCQTTYYPNGLEIRYCTDCDNTQPPSNCGPRYSVREGSGNTPSPGPTQPSSTPPPPSNETHVNNQPGHIGAKQSLTITCPNGSTPNVDGKCPTSSSSSSNKALLPPPSSDHHHHKRSDLGKLGGGGERGSMSSKRGGSNNSPTPPECPDKGPIPPNCTMKPTF